MNEIKLTHNQVRSLREFIQYEFIPSVQNDSEEINIDYVTNICDVYKQLKECEKKRNEEIEESKE